MNSTKFLLEKHPSRQGSVAKAASTWGKVVEEGRKIATPSASYGGNSGKGNGSSTN